MGDAENQIAINTIQTFVFDALSGVSRKVASSSQMASETVLNFLERGAQFPTVLVSNTVVWGW